eukprot:GILK01003131.1.p1 GENE.GILK01003131.1~~GILK01003131.1.p1  ORF type:complete len:959 (-),score=197.79 GILK01003131.1:288-3164(-)
MAVSVPVYVYVAVVLCATSLYTASANYVVAEDFLKYYATLSNGEFAEDATAIRASIAKHQSWKTALWNTDEEYLLILAAEHHCRYHAITDPDAPPPSRSEIAAEYEKMNRLAADFDERYGVLETLVQEVETATRKQLTSAFSKVAANDAEEGKTVFQNLRKKCKLNLNDQCNPLFYASFFTEVLLTRPSVPIDCHKTICKVIHAMSISDASKATLQTCLKVDCEMEPETTVDDNSAISLMADLYKRYTNNNWHVSKELYGKDLIPEITMKMFKQYRFLTYSPILTGALMNAIASMKLNLLAGNNGMQMVLLQRNGGAGSKTLTSDIDVNTNGFGTAVIVQTFNSMFRQNYKKESGSFFDINVYGLDYLWLPLTNMNHEPLVAVQDICAFPDGGQLAIAEAINDMFAIAKFYRFLRESTHPVLDQEPQKQLETLYGVFLSALPDSAQAVAKAAMKYVENWISRKHEVALKEKEKRLQARKAEIQLLASQPHTFLAQDSKEKEEDEVEVDPHLELSRDESTTVATSHLSTNELREVEEAEIEMSALNPVYEKMLYAVEALRLQLSTEQNAARRQEIQIKLAYLVSRALTWANEAYLSPGAVRYVVGALQLRKSLEELGVTMNMILQALNEQAGDAIKEIYMHILPRSDVPVTVTVDMVRSMLMAATKYLMRFVEAGKQFYALVPGSTDFEDFAHIHASLSLLDGLDKAQQLLTTMKESRANLYICQSEEDMHQGNKARFLLSDCPDGEETKETQFSKEEEHVIFVRQVVHLLTPEASLSTTHPSGSLGDSDARELVRQFRSGLVHATAAFNHYARNVKCPTTVNQHNPCISQGVLPEEDTITAWEQQAEAAGTQLQKGASTLPLFADKPVENCDTYQGDRRTEILISLRGALGAAVPEQFRAQAFVHTHGSYRKWKIASFGNPIAKLYSKDDMVIEEMLLTSARAKAEKAARKRRASAVK